MSKQVKVTSWDGADYVAEFNHARRGFNVAVGPRGFEAGDGDEEVTVAFEDDGNGQWSIVVYDGQSNRVAIVTVENAHMEGE